MIASWYWHYLLVGIGTMAVGAKAFAPRHIQDGDSNYNITFSSPISLTLGEKGAIVLESPVTGTFQNLSLILLQYLGGDPGQAANLMKVLDVKTGKQLQKTLGDSSVVNNNDLYLGICLSSESPNNCAGSNVTLPGVLYSTTIDFDLERSNNNTEAAATQNLLFCIGPFSNPFNICDYYSDIFNLALPGDVLGPPAPSVVFSSTVTITETTSAQQLQLHLVTTTTSLISAPTPASNSSSPTTSISVITATQTPSSTAAPVATASKHTSGLSTGAKIGIALGSLAVVSVLLLLALFFLRKKHSKRALKQTSRPEQVLLTRDMHTDSFTRNQLMLEKDRNPSSTIAPHDGLDTPLEETSPTASSNTMTAIQQQQRHSALSPYEPLPSAPYGGSISPRRKPAPSSLKDATPTTTNVASSQNPPVSKTTSPPPHSSSSSNSPSRSDSETPASAFEAYHDIPIYGDARHLPQVFSNAVTERERERGIESPFLREEMEGMSPEEVARLEEEERRIDAAIAAAEAGR